jgi:hypothetical protein
MQKKTLVLGASVKEDRYANKAVKKLRANHIAVVAIGLKKGNIGDVFIETEKLSYPDIHTITLYVGPQHQQTYYTYILSLHPKRVLFNPGTENAALVALLKENNIESEVACTLVLLATGQY